MKTALFVFLAISLGLIFLIILMFITCCLIMSKDEWDLYSECDEEDE